MTTYAVGRLLPRATLSEQDLSQRFGVSRTPVREAFHRLEAERFSAAEYDESVDGRPPSFRRRIAWYGLGFALIAGYSHREELSVVGERVVGDLHLQRLGRP